MPDETREAARIGELLAAGKLRAHEIEQYLRSERPTVAWEQTCGAAAGARRAFLAGRVQGSALEAFGLGGNLGLGVVRRGKELTRIENCIGTAQIPIGYAGPLTVDGENARGDFWVPVATNEAALVAGLNRGMKVVTATGGASTRIWKDGMTRAPLLVADRPEIAAAAETWLRGDEALKVLSPLVAETTSHGRLLEIRPLRGAEEPQALFVRFRFFTGDAMGMNMATIASERLVKEIVKRFPGLSLLALSGNLCSDKKSTQINVVEGRGLSVDASVTISGSVLREMEVDPERVSEVNRLKNHYGSRLAGTFGGFNAHAANQVAAIFASTGQDLAQVVESASCTTLVERTPTGLLVRCILPSLEVGTVGGGTDTPTALAALSLLGCAGGGDPPGAHRRKLGEIVAATVLAGELNLLLALSRNELASSHARLTR